MIIGNIYIDNKLKNILRRKNNEVSRAIQKFAKKTLKHFPYLNLHSKLIITSNFYYMIFISILSNKMRLF